MNAPIHPESDAPEYAPTFSLDRQIAAARKAMGAERWKQLCAEFDAPPPPMVAGAGR